MCVRAFDFGPESQTVWPGFVPVSWNTLYTKERGYGLARAQPDPNRARDDTFPTRLISDWLWIEEGDFRVDLPNGRYRVWAVFNDCGYWGGEYARHTVRAIAAEGREACREDRGAHGGDWEALHLFEGVEPRPGADLAALYYDRLFAPRVFDVEVKDGQLNLEAKADAPFSAKLAAVIVAPAGSGEAAAWVKGSETANRNEFRSRAPETPLPSAPASAALPAEAKARGYVLFAPAEDETVWFTSAASPRQRPGPGRVARRAAKGETVAATLAIRPLRDLGALRAEPTDLLGAAGTIPAGAVTIRAVRHLAKRGFNALRWKLTPWYLDDAAGTALAPGLTRQIWITIAVPRAAKPGEYRGTLALRSSKGLEEAVALDLTVLPFELEEPDIPVGFYGMREEWLGTMRQYGMTGLSGGPNIRFKDFGPRGVPRLDFDETDRYLDAAANAGYALPILSYGGPANLEDVGYENAEEVCAAWGKPAGLAALDAAKRILGEMR
ncbi:MAG: hypothetical protein AAB368_14780, partial [bacterium]